MLIKEPRTFFEATKPIVYFNCFIGTGTYRQPNMTDTAYFCMQIYTIIFFLTNLTMTYFGLVAMSDITELYDTSPMAKMMYLVLVYTNSCFAVTSPFLLWRQNKGLVVCLQQIPVLDEAFQGIIRDRNEYKKFYIRLTCQVIGILLVMSLVCFCDSAWMFVKEVPLLDYFAIAFTLHYPIMVMLVLDLNFCVLIGYLRDKFRALNDGLLGLADKPSASCSGKKVFVISRKVFKVTPSSQIKDVQGENWAKGDHYLLNEMRKAHLELCDLSCKINLAFGVQNLLSMGISFVMVTGLSYTTYSTVIWEDLTSQRIEDLLPTVLWILIYSFKIWVVNHSSWIVSSEADRTGEVVYELLETKTDPQLQKQMQEFGVQMLQNPVSFNACGFFTLDYTFVQGVIGSVTTYLVILIQMSRLSGSPTTETELD